MKKSYDETVSAQRRMYISIISTLVFAILMGAFIVYFYEGEPNLKGQILFQRGDQLEDAAITSHWQWQAEGRPQRIILVHYNSNGKETDRSPVLMNQAGWPEVKPSSEGCQKLWQMLLHQPMEVDGFRVRGEYEPGDDDEKQGSSAYCRFSLSSGDYFDYAINRGDVTFEDD